MKYDFTWRVVDREGAGRGCITEGCSRDYVSTEKISLALLMNNSWDHTVTMYKYLEMQFLPIFIYNVCLCIYTYICMYVMYTHNLIEYSAECYELGTNIINTV